MQVNQSPNQESEEIFEDANRRKWGRVDVSGGRAAAKGGLDAKYLAADSMFTNESIYSGMVQNGQTLDAFQLHLEAHVQSPSCTDRNRKQLHFELKKKYLNLRSHDEVLQTHRPVEGRSVMNTLPVHTDHIGDIGSAKLSDAGLIYLSYGAPECTTER